MSDTIDALAGGPIDNTAQGFAQDMYGAGGAVTAGMMDVIGSGFVDVVGGIIDMNGMIDVSTMGFSVDTGAANQDVASGGSNDIVGLSVDLGTGSYTVADLSNGMKLTNSIYDGSIQSGFNGGGG